MARFYGKRVVGDGAQASFRLTIARPDGARVEIEISEALFEEVDELQREFWRLEKRESRHTSHIEMLTERDLPHGRHVKDPEQLLMDKLESARIKEALLRIPAIQARRFLFHYVFGVHVKSIAAAEGCSMRAVKYSLARARRNLAEILAE